MAQPTRRDLDVAITTLADAANSFIDDGSEFKTRVMEFFPDMTGGDLSKALRAVQSYLEGWSEYGRG